MREDVLSLPVDEQAREALAAQGLRIGVVDPRDVDATRNWLRADARGFYDPEPSDAFFADLRDDFADQRSVAVLDPSIADAAVPVATTTSWPMPLTLPGGEVGAWAITGVSVAPTHRRRGIARALLEAELRTAAAAELPLAVLTVSEATIYGRWGFGPAAWSADLEVESRRAGWVGGEVPGRVQLVDRAAAMRDGRALFEAARRRTIGDVVTTGHRYDRLFGLPSDDEDLRRRRFVRYDDEAGDPRGLAVYTVTEDDRDFTKSTVDVRHLAAATDEAYRAIWRFLLELDLVATVRARLRSTDDPLRWLVRDQRAIRTTELREHLWVRVLDPVAAFSARSYAANGRLGLRVDDPLGYADGSFVVHASDSFASRVARASAGGDDPVLDLPVDLLGSLLLGGVSAETLRRAGRLTERSPGDAVAADRLLRAPTAPMLATWF